MRQATSHRACFQGPRGEPACCGGYHDAQDQEAKDREEGEVTIPATVPMADAIATAEEMVRRLRDRIDADPYLPQEVRRMAHLELDAAMFKFLADVARTVGVLQ
jgi:hypothetical protein